MLLVGTGFGWCRVVCLVSRPGLRVPLRQPLRGGLRTALRIALRIALRRGLRRALCPGVRRRVMVGLGLPKLLGMLLVLLGKVDIGMPPLHGQQSLGEAW